VQTFLAVQHRAGQQKAVQAKNGPVKTAVIKTSAAYLAGLQQLPTSLRKHCGNGESAALGPVCALIKPLNGSRKQLC
jgi:hypothetical protein